MVNSQKTMSASGAVSKITTTVSLATTTTLATTAPSSSALSAATTTPIVTFKRIYITCVDSLGPYIMIEGLLHSDALEIVQQRIENMLPYCKTINFDWPVDRQREILLPDVWCIYKQPNAGNNKFSRARIINVIPATTSQTPLNVEIDIIDYDERTIVNSCDLLLPQQPDKLKYLPTLCSQYIVLGISEDWNEDQLKEISRMIQYRTANFFIVKKFMDFKFIRMKWKDFNFDEYVILHKNIGAPIEDNVVFNNFEKILKEYEHKQQQQKQRIDENHFEQTSSNTLNTSNVNDSKSNNNSKSYIGAMVSNGGSTCINDHFNKRINFKKPPPANPDDGNISDVYISKERVRPMLTGRKNPPSSHPMAMASTQNSFRAINQTSHIRHIDHSMMYKANGPQQVPYVQEYPRLGILRPVIPGDLTITHQNGMYNSVNYHGLEHSNKLEFIPQYNIDCGTMWRRNRPLNMASYNGGIQANQMISSKQMRPHYQSTLNTYAQYQGSYVPLQSSYRQNILPVSTNIENLPSSSTKISNRHSQPIMHAVDIAAVYTPTISSPPKQQQQRSTTATFKSNSLTVHQVYEVSVSFVEDGPFMFSVQLVSAQESLTDMMNCIEKMPLQKFTGKPALGTACIARYSEDGQLYRALITGVQPTCCKVAYIDYGNAEIVDYSDLYEIPDEFLVHKAFAMRFTLSGHKELEPIDESLNKAFKDLVLYKNCQLKVMPLEGPPLVQYCKLYLKQSEESDVLSILKQIQMTRLVYPKADRLLNNDIVEIRYIDSPRHFYVQKVENIPEFEQLMDDIYLYYNKNQVVPNNLVLGAPCIVKYENEWYRAEVMRNDACSIMVRHVDFGYEQVVTKNLLSTIAEKHLKLPRQAIQCCLKGFENKEMNTDSASTQFEMLAEKTNRKRRSFTVKVFRLQPDGVHLVNLYTKDINVMKKLYKLSMPFEQYLHFEKADFNMNPHKQKSINDDKENAHKTPSITSSSEVASSVKSSSSTKQSRGSPIPKSNTRMHSQSTIANLSWDPNESVKALKPIKMPTGNSTSNTVSIGWDDQSTHGSISTNHPNSLSSSDGINLQHKQSNFNKNKSNNNGRSINDTNNNINSGNSYISVSGSGYSNYNNISQSQQHNEVPPRFSHYKSMQQQRMSRPRNAPQGFSQKQRPSNDKYNKPIKSKPSASSAVPLCNVPIQKKQQKLQKEPSLTSSSVSSTKQNANASLSQTKENMECKNKEIYMPLNENFPVEPIKTPVTYDVNISWWVSPNQFYTQLKSRIEEFEQFTQSIQKFYADKPLQQLQLKIGSNVMARHREDNVIYRARILGCNQMLRKYKVVFVDVGHEYTVTSEDIWQVEQRFFNFPVMAYMCSLQGIISNFDHLYIIDCMDKYLQLNARTACDYTGTASNNPDLYYVNVTVNERSLKELLIKDGLISYISQGLRLDLLAGQQVRAKLFAIKDMLNFKIELPCHCDNIEYIPLLCSYDDVRFVKSNPELAVQFKSFYENKTCILNIKHVNYNKVLFVRPLMPLMKDDIDSLICTPPVVLETFKVRIVYVASPYRLYGQMLSTESRMIDLLNDMYNYYETEGKGFLLKSFDLGQICAAKGSDGNWYRARIITTQLLFSNSTTYLDVYYPDYGNTESVAKGNLKYLEEKFYKNINAYGLEINLPIKPLSYDKYQQQHHQPQQKQMEKENKKYSNIASGSSTSSAANDNELDIKVINYLSEITLDKSVVVKALEMRHNHLIADLIMPQNQSIVDMLKDEKLIVERNIDCMRKILDQEKPNTLEYIEMVDLTLEDDAGGEVDANKKHKIKSTTGISAKEEDSFIKLEAQEETLKANDKIPTLNKGPKNQDSSPTLPQPTANEDSIKAASEDVAKEKEINNSNDLEKMESGILSHCDNPAQFFIHPINIINDLKGVHDNLQIVASLLPPLMGIVNGAYCVSQYSVDKKWYRTQILDAELMVLQFIDYGNTDCVSDASHLKEMLIYPELKPLCIPCALPIQPNGTTDWVDAANAIFNNSYDKVLKFKFILDRRDTGKKNFIDLYIDGVNVTKHLIKEGYAQPLQLVDSGETCYISHVNGINDFYIQYEKNSKALELMELYFADYEKLEVLQEFVPHKVVAARFRDDQMWYRAELLKETKDGYEVLFIDYGNTSISTECREIFDKNITLLLPLSQKCSLELPDFCVNWSEAAEKKFHEIAATGETIFTVELREPARDHAVVHLLIDGHNIIDDLAVLCEKKLVNDNNDENYNDVYLASSDSREDSSAIVSNIEPTNDIHPSLSKNVTQIINVDNVNGIPMRESSAPDNYQFDTNKCVITHAVSPKNFYVQLKSDSKVLNYINKYLRHSEFVKKLEVLNNIEAGKLCVVYCTEDDCYYRGRIIKDLNNNGKCEIFLLDYGNTIIASDIKEIPDALVDIPEQALHCQLNAIPRDEVNEKRVDEIFTNLMETHFGDIYDIEIINYANEKTTTHIVKLQVNHKDLAEELIEAVNTLHKSVDNNNTEFISPELYDVVILYINSPQSFYVLLPEHKKSIIDITKRLLNAEQQYPVLNDFEVGKKCIAQFPEDGAYYRAEIVRVLDDRKCEVHYIDFGNNSITDQIREVPEDLLNTERCSKHCTLDSSCPISEQFNEQFSVFYESRVSETFQLQFLKTSSQLATVHLYYHGNNIIHEIQKLLNLRDHE